MLKYRSSNAQNVLDHGSSGMGAPDICSDISLSPFCFNIISLST